MLSSNLVFDNQGFLVCPKLRLGLKNMKVKIILQSFPASLLFAFVISTVMFFKYYSEIIKPVSPQTAQLGIINYLSHRFHSEHLFEGPDLGHYDL